MCRILTHGLPCPALAVQVPPLNAPPGLGISPGRIKGSRGHPWKQPLGASVPTFQVRHQPDPGSPIPRPSGPSGMGQAGSPGAPDLPPGVATQEGRCQGVPQWEPRLRATLSSRQMGVPSRECIQEAMPGDQGSGGVTALRPALVALSVCPPLAPASQMVTWTQMSSSSLPEAGGHLPAVVTSQRSLKGPSTGSGCCLGGRGTGPVSLLLH